MMMNRRRISIPIFNVFLFISGNALDWNNSGIHSNPKNLEIGYFWHLSDIFFDPSYSPSGTPEDDCHIKNDTINITNNCGFFGENGKCSSFGLIETIARAMNSTRWRIASPEFCIFTGNLRCPNLDESRSNNIAETISAFIADIQNAAFLDVYPSYGWYDYHPYGHHPLKLNAVYNKLENLLNQRKSNASIFGRMNKKTGYFSRVERSQKKIRFIVMNTNFYITKHIASRLFDPAEQWEWLRDELKKCRIAGQKAFIVMSIPPGINGNSYEVEKNLNEAADDLLWRDQHNRQYIEIIHEFHDVIAAQFSGHRHEDNFRLIYNKKGKAVSVILMAPAVNQIFGNYPAMRIYMYDKISGKLLDFVQYFFNLTKANSELDTKRPEKYWEVSYSFRDQYLLPDATVPSFEKLVKNFRKNDIMFQRYYKNSKGLIDQGKEICEMKCKLITFCVITNVDLGSFFECISGELTSYYQRVIRQSQPTPEALRNRLIRWVGITNSGVSVSGVPNHRRHSVRLLHHIIIIILYYHVFNK